MTSKVKAIGLLVAVAVAGFAAGAASRSWAENRANAAIDWREQCSYSAVMSRELQLTPAQRDSIHAIMQRRRPQMRAVLEPVRPQMDSLRALTRAEIRAVLTPQQASAWDSLHTRERAQRERGDSTAGGSR